jgi:hypothetical protein
VNNFDNPDLTWAWFDDFNDEVLLNISDGQADAFDTAVVTVLNVPPVIDVFDGPSEVVMEEEALFYMSFYDGFLDPIRGLIASSDTYEASFDWGDGTSNEFPLGIQEFSVLTSHVYFEAGEYIITIVVLDDDGGQAIMYWYINVVGALQYVDAGPDGELFEGSEFISNGSLADDSGTYTAQVDYGDETGIQDLLLNPGNVFDLQHIYYDDGVYEIVVTAYNEGYEWGSDVAEVTVHNLPPTIESLSAQTTDPIELGTPVQLTGEFSDPGLLDTHVALIEWGDGEASSFDIEQGTYLVSSEHVYAEAGVYLITLTVTDDDGDFDSESLDYYVVVYDPNGGFVTGGGWIIAQPGSYPSDPTLTGKATFGFVSKYKKGRTYPEGNTEFQFHAAGLNFHSHTYEWMVISGSKATYKGVGTINGEGNYEFKLTAIDGKKINDVDKFRIKIWDEDNNIVFDNNLGMPDDDDPVTALESGQITIHKK